MAELEHGRGPTGPAHSLYVEAAQKRWAEHMLGSSADLDIALNGFNRARNDAHRLGIQDTLEQSKFMVGVIRALSEVIGPNPSKAEETRAALAEAKINLFRVTSCGDFNATTEFLRSQNKAISLAFSLDNTLSSISLKLKAADPSLIGAWQRDRAHFSGEELKESIELLRNISEVKKTDPAIPTNDSLTAHSRLDSQAASLLTNAKYFIRIKESEVAAGKADVTTVNEAKAAILAIGGNLLKEIDKDLKMAQMWGSALASKGQADAPETYDRRSRLHSIKALIARETLEYAPTDPESRIWYDQELLNSRREQLRTAFKGSATTLGGSSPMLMAFIDYCDPEKDVAALALNNPYAMQVALETCASMINFSRNDLINPDREQNQHVREAVINYSIKIFAKIHEVIIRDKEIQGAEGIALNYTNLKGALADRLHEDCKPAAEIKPGIATINKDRKLFAFTKERKDHNANIDSQIELLLAKDARPHLKFIRWCESVLPSEFRYRDPTYIKAKAAWIEIADLHMKFVKANKGQEAERLDDLVDRIYKGT